MVQIVFNDFNSPRDFRYKSSFKSQKSTPRDCDLHGDFRIELLHKYCDYLTEMAQETTI